MIHPSVQLVSAETVASIRGLPRAAIYKVADGNFAGCSYNWVWNVGTGSERELRFWSKEVNDQKSVAHLSIDQVIQHIVPRREKIPGQFCGMRNWEVGDLLRVSNITLLALRKELEVVAREGGIYIPRHSLENFFRRRWCYADTAQLCLK